MGVDYKDYYKILNVDRSASQEDLAKAFKKLARKYHPDLNPGDKTAEDKFKELNEAYEVLKDEEKRRLYDQLGPNWKNNQQFQGNTGFENFQFHFENDYEGRSGGFSDFFESVFGQSRGRPGNFGPDPFGNFSSRTMRGRDIEAELSISLEEALKGGTRPVTLQTDEGTKTLNVTIPAGVREGAKLRLGGQGSSSPSGQSGDLYLRILFAHHPLFKVEGDNIVYHAAIMPWQAVLGDKIRIPTLEGEVDIRIPAGTSSGKRMRLKGKGLGPAGKRGDEFVSVAIQAPTQLTEEQRSLWEALAVSAQKQAASDGDPHEAQ